MAPTKMNRIQKWLSRQEAGYRFSTTEITGRVNLTSREISEIIRDMPEVHKRMVHRGITVWEVKKR